MQLIEHFKIRVLYKEDDSSILSYPKDIAAVDWGSSSRSTVLVLDEPTVVWTPKSMTSAI